MKHTDSLKKNAEFRLVYNKGRSVANRFLVVYVRKNGKNENKLGVSVSKKVGGSVVRSRVGRLIKESYRLLEDKTKTGRDIVVIARVSAKTASFWDIDSAMRHLLKKHDLLQ